MSIRRVILLELNELCPELMARFRAAGELPNFDRLYKESEVYLSRSDEDMPLLEPWIQWVTVHSGIPYQQHRVHDLGDGDRLSVPSIWDLASDAGLKVWVCGSMNASYRAPLSGWFLPDPWTKRVSPHPAELDPYYRFVRANVLDHTAQRPSSTRADHARFLAFMTRHGLSFETIKAIGKQLADEAATRRARRWKRATLLDKLQFDLFRWYFEKERPQLATFFSNSTAHFQHVYWRHMEPERFRNKPTLAERARYRDAILYGYKEMDRLVGRFLGLAGDDTTLVFSTALSQQPCLAYEDQGGKTFHRPRDLHRLLAAVGVRGRPEYSPVMANQFHLDFADEGEAAEAEERLGALTLSGSERAMNVRRKGKSLFAGCRIFRPVDDATSLEGAGIEPLRFGDHFFRVGLVKSGMHHPDGMLWVRTPERRHVVHPGRVSIVSVAPTVLEMLGVTPPSYMEAPLRRRIAPAASYTASAQPLAARGIT